MTDAEEPRRLARVLGRLDLHAPSDLVAELSVFAGAVSLAEIGERLRAQAARDVDAILALTEDFDAFDVIDLMRQREIPISPVLALDPAYDGSSAAIEIAALLMLSRGSRKANAVPREDTRPHEAIAEIHERAKRLLRLSTFRAKACEFVRGREPLARLSADYQAYLVGVRSLQYQSIQGEHERALFERPEIDGILREHLGFTYGDFVAVQDAVHERYSDSVIGLRDLTGEIVMSAQREGREPVLEEMEAFQRSMIEWMFLPGERASFTASDIAEHGGLDLDVVERVLSSFSLDFESVADPTSVVTAFLTGRNPLARHGLVRDDDRHVIVGGPIGGDSFRATAEVALKPSTDWHRYDTTRRVVSESLAVSPLERLLGCPALATGLEYFAPREDFALDSLGRDCADPTVVGNLVESDALFVVEDVAICLEVKGRSVAEPARRGDLRRLETEIKNILGSGANQARRLEALIRENGGVWVADGSWLDLTQVREVRTVVAGLDYFGPLGVALGDLADSGLVGVGHMPWIVSIHDLEVISRVIDRPAEFLLYLRRRSASAVAQHFRGADELDLFMLFMDGGLFVEDDPNEVHSLHPRSAPPTRTSQRRHEDAAQSTLVGTFTDPLDAWMYWVDGSSPYEADKPTFNVDPDMAKFVDFLARGPKPGWFRVGADLLALEGRAQSKLLASVRRLVDVTCSDARPHNLVQGFASTAGYMTFFAATVPVGADRDEESVRLRTYMLTKKHQIRSDRSLGILLTNRGDVVQTIYMNHQPGDDEDLDALGEAMGLRRTWEKPKRASSLSEKKRRRRSKRGR